MSTEPISKEWLESKGFTEEPNLHFMQLELAEGPGDSSVALVVGNYPFNEMGCTLIVDGYGVEAQICSRDDIETLIRLFKGSAVDHPHEAWIDDDEE